MSQEVRSLGGIVLLSRISSSSEHNRSVNLLETVCYKLLAYLEEVGVGERHIIDKFVHSAGEY